MASLIVQPYQSARITVAAGAALATFSNAPYTVMNTQVFNNVPSSLVSAFSGSGNNVTSAYAAATVVYINAGSQQVLYNSGTNPAIIENINFRPAPGTLNATGTLTAALLLGKIVTSTTAAAVTATLDTGANIDAAQNHAVGDSIPWNVINTGGTNAFTLAASTGHTIVGSAVVAATGSGAAEFLTVKTAPATYVTYRMA